MTEHPLTAIIRQQIAPLVEAGLDHVFPAAALVIHWCGDVIIEDAWGWIDPQTRQHAITPGTRFDLASLTKLFTVTAFMGLVSAGKVGLDDPLIRVLPEFGAASPRGIDGGQDPHSKQHLPTPDALRGRTVDPARVTFRHLLTHTSGLPPWRDVFNAAGPPPAPPAESDPVSRAERWQRGLMALCAYPFVGEPGDVVRYSDVGLMLLGEAVSRLDSGCSGALDCAIQRRVCDPLGLVSVTFNPIERGIELTGVAPTEDDPHWRGRRCWGQVHDENAAGLGGVAGHAGLFGAAADVAALGQAWLDRDPRLRIDPALAAEAARQHAETDGERRGLGWMLKSLQGSAAGDIMHASTYGHTGFTGTSLFIDSTRALVVALLTNRVYPGRDVPGITAFRRALHDAIAEAVNSC